MRRLLPDRMNVAHIRRLLQRDEFSLMNFFAGHPAGQPCNAVSGQRSVADRLQIIHIER
jgi:hypothetical protein